MDLRGGADIVVATPGRLLDLVKHNAVKLGAVATRLETSAASFATQKNEPAVTDKTADPTTAKATELPPEPVASNSITAAQFNELKGSLEKLTETFNTALNQGKGQQVPNTTGAVTDEPEPVY